MHLKHRMQGKRAKKPRPSFRLIICFFPANITMTDIDISCFILTGTICGDCSGRFENVRETDFRALRVSRILSRLIHRVEWQSCFKP